MAIGERFRGGGTRGIASFLADHQHCDAGFDVRREDPPGGGKLRITCEGCGESIAYNAAEAGELAAAAVPVAAANGEARSDPAAEPLEEEGGAGQSGRDDAGGDHPGAGPRPGDGEHAQGPQADLEPSTPPRDASSGRSRSRLPGWIPIALIGALFVGGLAMIGAGLLRSGDEGPTPADTTAATEAAPPPAEPAPAAPATAPSGPALDQREFERFSIGVPAGWDVSGEGDSATLQSPGDAAEVAVFVGPSDRSPLEFAELSGGFLADRHAGAVIGAPRPARFRGQPAATVRVVYPGGGETATFLSADGFAYVLIEQLDDDASPRITRQAAAAKRSFKPV